MKKLFILVVVVTMSAMTVNAQGWIIGGSLEFNVTDNEIPLSGFDMGGVTTTFSITPTVHTMISDKWAAGLGLGYSYAKIDDMDLKMNLFSVTPSVIYFGKLAERFYYTPEFYIGIGFGKLKNTENSDGEVDITNFGVGIAPFSFEFRVTDRLGINMTAGNISYTNTKLKGSGGGGSLTNTSLNLRFNSAFKFGVRFYF